MNDDNVLGFQKKHFDAIEKLTAKPTNRIEEIKERLKKIDPNMQVYRCRHYMDEDEACGIYEGQSLDCSHDECHHPLNRDLAEYIVNTPADIQHLLSKLEIAEKALLRIAYETLDDGSIAMTACMELGIEPTEQGE